MVGLLQVEDMMRHDVFWRTRKQIRVQIYDSHGAPV